MAGGASSWARLLLLALAVGLVACTPLRRGGNGGGGDDDDDDDSAAADDDDSVGADADGDGFGDDEEVAEGTDPDDPYSWPYEEGRWPGFGDEAAAAGLSSSGWGMGATAPNVVFGDQYGNAVELYDFYGHVVALQLHTGWSGPCITMGMETQAWWEFWREDGMIVLHFLLDTAAQNPPETADLWDWAFQVGVEHPVLTQFPVTEPDAMGQGEVYSFVVPTTILLSREMVVSGVFEGFPPGGPSDYDADVNALVFDPLPW